MTNSLQQNSGRTELVPRGCFGPYLQAVLSTIAGGYHLSKPQVQQMVGDLFGLPLATGMVSKLERQSVTVLEAPYNEVAVGVHDTPTASIEDTSWRKPPQGLPVGGRHLADNGLHHRSQTVRCGGQGAVGEQAESGGHQ